eukprot:g5766.t1
MTRSVRTREMQTDSFFKARVENISSGGLILALVGFILSIVFCSLLSQLSPKIFLTSGKSNALVCEDYLCSPTFTGYLNSLTKMHQVFYLEMSLEKPYVYGQKEVDDENLLEKFDLQFEITASGEHFKNENWKDREVIIGNPPLQVIKQVTCPKKSDTCKPITLFAEDFLNFQGYWVNVTFVHPYLTAGLVTEEGHTTALANSVSGMKGAHDDLGKKVKKMGMFLPHALSGRFEMKYVNVHFTEFEFALKYFFVSASVIVSYLYFTGLRKHVNQQYWSYEQKWVAYLSILLIFFNDPFFVLEIYTPNILWTALYVLQDTAFLMSLLLFWLCVFAVISRDAYWEERTEARGLFFYGPKIILVLFMWLLATTTYMWVRLQTEGDPSKYATTEFEHFTFAKMGLEVLFAVYAVYLGVLIVQTVFAATRFRGTTKPQFIFVFAVTIIAVLIAIVGLLMGAFAPEVIYVVEFTTFYGACNCYIFLLCYAYYPDTYVPHDDIIDPREEVERDRGVNGGIEMSVDLGNAVNKMNDAAARARISLDPNHDPFGPVKTSVSSPKQNQNRGYNDVESQNGNGNGEAKFDRKQRNSQGEMQRASQGAMQRARDLLKESTFDDNDDDIHNGDEDEDDDGVEVL